MPDNLKYKVNTEQDILLYRGQQDIIIALLKDILKQEQANGYLLAAHPISVALLDIVTSTNAGSPTLIKFSKVINSFFIQNNTSANLFIEFDGAAGPASPVLLPGSSWEKNIHLQSFYIYTAAAQSINAASGIIIRGWL